MTWHWLLHKGLNISILSLMGLHKPIFCRYKSNLSYSMLILNSISNACIAGPACPPLLDVNTAIFMLNVLGRLPYQWPSLGNSWWLQASERPCSRQQNINLIGSFKATLSCSKFRMVLKGNIKNRQRKKILKIWALRQKFLTHFQRHFFSFVRRRAVTASDAFRR